MEQTTLQWEGNRLASMMQRRTKAIGVTAHGSWILNRRGARHLLDIRGQLKPRVIIQAANSSAAPVEVPLGYEKSVKLGGEKSFGWTFAWDLPHGLRQDGYAIGTFTTEAGDPLVSIRAFSKVIANGRDLTEGEVRIRPGALALPELSEMILVAWYAMRDGAA